MKIVCILKNSSILKIGMITPHKFKIEIILLLVFGITGLKAQETISVTGNDLTGVSGSVSYSIGQVVYTANIGAIGSVAQGVQQPFEILVVTGLEEAKGINLSVSAYPNPTTDYLILKVENFEISTLYFRLFDMNGKLLQNEKITSNKTIIVLSNLVPATYFVNVIKGKEEVKTFKIMKY